MDEANPSSDYLCFKFGKVYRSVQRYYETNLLSYGLTPVQFFTMNILNSHDGMKFKDLATALSIEGATLSGIIDRMERAGFLTRRADPDDRRSILLFLTENGKQVGPIVKELGEKLDTHIRDQFEEQEFATFLQVLDRMMVPDQDHRETT